MRSVTTLVAEQYRLQEWASQIKACQNRPDGMLVNEWCQDNGITRANYYYRLRRVRQACLDSNPSESHLPVMVSVPPEIMDPEPTTSAQAGIDILAGVLKIHVTDSTPLELLGRVLKVIAHVE